MPRHKRSRGAQPGNQNARKHGFYAVNLSAEEAQEFYRLVNQEGLPVPIARVRLKLAPALREDPSNNRIFLEGARTIANHFIEEQGLEGEAASLIRKGFRDILGASLCGDPHRTEQIVANFRMKVENLQDEGYLGKHNFYSNLQDESSL